ncbi:MAG: calcium/sodium antiporter [Isosphaeraceae bacterium]
MTTSVGLVLLGLILLVFGGECLLRGAVGLATLAKVTPAVIGLTVVAFGTSVPELAVSMIAALQGNEGVAVGNVVGSNVFNLTLIIGLAALIHPLGISGNTIRLEYPVLLLVSLLFLVLANDGLIGRLDAGLLVATYVGFTAYLVVVVRRQINVTEAKALGAEVSELAEPMVALPRSWVSLGLIVAGIGLLIAGAQSTVTGAVAIGRTFGMSEAVIGLTIVAVGTGLPEVVTSLISSVRGRDDVAIGNVIGSNLFNILGVLGLGGLVRPIPVPREIVTTDVWWMLGLTVLFGPLLLTGRRIARSEGLLLLGIYGIYMAFLLSRSTTP